MASIVLPTLEWTRFCQQLYDQLEPDDEFLLVCDTDADSVASAALPEDVELVLAGRGALGRPTPSPRRSSAHPGIGSSSPTTTSSATTTGSRR